MLALTGIFLTVSSFELEVAACLVIYSDSALGLLVIDSAWPLKEQNLTLRRVIFESNINDIRTSQSSCKSWTSLIWHFSACQPRQTVCPCAVENSAEYDSMVLHTAESEKQVVPGRGPSVNRLSSKLLHFVK